MAKHRPFPHLPLVDDPAVQASARLLWDRAATLHDGIGEEQAALIAGARAIEDIPALLRQDPTRRSRVDDVKPGRCRPTTRIHESQLITEKFTRTGADWAAFLRDGQPILPIMWHYMEAFSRYTRDRSQVEEELKAIKAAGYTGIRFLDILNVQPFWEGREVNPIDVPDVAKTERYYEKLEDFLAYCKEIGLLVNWSRGDLEAYSSDQRTEHFTRIGEIACAVGVETIAVFEVVNESDLNGFTDDFEGLLPLLNTFFSKAGTTMLSALSSPLVAEDEGELARTSAGVPIAMAHGHRGNDLYNKLFAIRVIRAAGELWPGKAVWQDEPPGAGTSGTDSPEEMDEQGMTLMALQALLHDQAYSVTLKNAVRWNSTFSKDAGFYAVPAAVAKLPNDLMTWLPAIRSEPNWPIPGVHPKAELIAHDLAQGPLIEQRTSFQQGSGRIAAIAYRKVGVFDTGIRSMKRRWKGSAYRFTNEPPYVVKFDTFDLSKGDHTSLNFPSGTRGYLLIGKAI